MKESLKRLSRRIEGLKLDRMKGNNKDLGECKPSKAWVTICAHQNSKHLTTNQLTKSMCWWRTECSQHRFVATEPSERNHKQNVHQNQTICGELVEMQRIIGGVSTHVEVVSKQVLHFLLLS